jgi:hypothetical protein
MKCRENQHLEHEMSTAIEAQGYVRLMIETEAKGWGDQTNALSRIEQRYGLSFWSLNNLRTGRAKTVEAGLLQRIRRAYVDMCERQIARLAHEVELERARDANAVDQDLAAEIERLAAKVRASKAKRGR